MVLLACVTTTWTLGAVPSIELSENDKDGSEETQGTDFITTVLLELRVITERPSPTPQHVASCRTQTDPDRSYRPPA
jgi:hypothetical protein